MGQVIWKLIVCIILLSQNVGQAHFSPVTCYYQYFGLHNWISNTQEQYKQGNPLMRRKPVYLAVLVYSSLNHNPCMLCNVVKWLQNEFIWSDEGQYDFLQIFIFMAFLTTQFFWLDFFKPGLQSC